MLPQSNSRKKRNSSKVNLMISFTFHALLVVVVLYFAARQGLLGTQMKKISIEMVKEKTSEKPKEPEKPRVEPPKLVEKPKVMEEAKIAPQSTMAQPMVAPPAAELPSFEFEGGKAVETSSDPVQLYKGAVEYALRSKWQRPDNIADDDYVAEVEVSVSRKGGIGDPIWKKGSGNAQWDDSVRKAIAAVQGMDRPPPTNFPSHMTVRFDVQEDTKSVFQ